MTGNAAGMTVRAGCYFKFGMSIPLAKVPFLRHFGGDRGAPGADAAAGVAAEAAAEAEGRGQERETGSRGGGNASGGGRRRRKSQLGPESYPASWGRNPTAGTKIGC